MAANALDTAAIEAHKPGDAARSVPQDVASETASQEFNKHFRAASRIHEKVTTGLPHLELYEFKDKKELAQRISAKADEYIKGSVVDDGYLEGLRSFAVGVARGLNGGKEEAKQEAKSAWNVVSSGEIVARTKEAVALGGETIYGAFRNPAVVGEAAKGLVGNLAVSTERFVSAAPVQQGEAIGSFLFWAANPEERIAELHNASSALGDSKAVAGLKKRYLELKESGKEKTIYQHKILPLESEESISGNKAHEISEPSEGFVKSCRQWMEAIPKAHVDFLLSKGVSFNACRSIGDLIENDSKTLGLFTPLGNKRMERNSIQIGEYYSRELGPALCPNPEWTLRHETGHALSFHLGKGSKRLSEDKGFIMALKKDWSNLPPSDLEWFEYCYEKHDQKRKAEELFADLYAHASGLKPEDNLYGKTKQSIRQCFPNSLETISRLISSVENR